MNDSAFVLSVMSNNSATTNVENGREKEIRLERLYTTNGDKFVEEIRCEFLLSYLVQQDGSEASGGAIKGKLYFFQDILYFHCPMQTQLQPYGEFVRYLEKKNIKYTDRES